MKTESVNKQSDIHQFDVCSSDSKNDILGKLSGNDIISPYQNIDEFLKQVDTLSEFLPIDVKAALKNFRRNSNRHGFLHLKGLTIDTPLPNTPTREYSTGVEKLKETSISEIWLCLIASFLGDPFGYKHEYSGDMFSNLLPGHVAGEEQLSENGKFILNFRTEVAFHSTMPDYILLFCLRPGQEKQTITYISCIREICNSLSEKEKELLRKPVYEIGISSNSERSISSNSTTTELSISRVMSILYGDPNDPFLRIDPHLMLANHSQAKCALDRIKDLLVICAMDVCMEAGDMLIIDNNRACHARGPYRARLDGNDRWLQKLFVSKNLDQFAASTGKNERLLSRLF